MGKGHHLHMPGLTEFHEELDHQIPGDTEQVCHPDLAQVRHEIVTKLHARVHNASLLRSIVWSSLAWEAVSTTGENLHPCPLAPQLLVELAPLRALLSVDGEDHIPGLEPGFVARAARQKPSDHNVVP